LASLDTIQAFDIELRPDRARIVVAPHGELDRATVPRLAAELDDLVRVGFTDLVLDLRGLTFIDAAGLRLVIAQTARRDVTVRLIQGSPLVERVMNLADTPKPLPFLEPDELVRRHY
jgi:anti-sigma B factor antagonist